MKTIKTITNILILIVSLNLSSQKWINETNCDTQSSEILNEAIQHFSNLEHLMAIGMAKAAYMSDSGCECAKLVMAAAAGSDANWGSRKAKLDDINTQLLSDEETTWYGMLVATLTGDSETYQSTLGSGLEQNPDSPLLNWLSVQGDYNKFIEFAEKFPANAAAAYNMIAYGYAYGDISGEPDFDKAYEAIEMSLTLHKGPNALDSKGEIAVMKGDYQTALENQLKAYDYAPFASPYQPKVVTYYRNVNKETIANNLKEAQKDLQDAITNSDLETYKKYVSDDIDLVTGDSNLGEFYVYSDDDVTRKRNFTWNSFDLNNMDVHFSPDMSMAILTFYAKGSYSFDDSDENIDYSTRASSVWIATDDGWKSVHSNWAPMKDGVGIPEE